MLIEYLVLNWYGWIVFLRFKSCLYILWVDVPVMCKVISNVFTHWLRSTLTYSYPDNIYWYLNLLLWTTHSFSYQIWYAVVPECDSNHYGPDCSNVCNCAVGDTRCDHVTGCICSEGWAGLQCDDDVNECLREDTCVLDNEICVNTDGSYQCKCHQGYERDDSGNCVGKEWDNTLKTIYSWP